jgi:hypothetical protein
MTMPMDPEHRENIRKAMQKYKRSNHNEAAGLSEDELFSALYEKYFVFGESGKKIYLKNLNEWLHRTGKMEGGK